MQQQAVPEATWRTRDWLPDALAGKQRVRLHVWACAATGLGAAVDRAMRAPAARRWDVVGTVEDVGPPCPIRYDDPAALTLGIDYEVAWAVYPAGGEQ